MVARFFIEHGSDHIPADTALTDMVQRSNQTRRMEWRVKGAGDRTDKTDLFCSTTHCRNGSERFHKPRTAIGNIAHRGTISKEHRIQFTALSNLRQAF